MPNGWHLWTVTPHVASSPMLHKVKKIRWFRKPWEIACSLSYKTLNALLHAVKQYLAHVFMETLATDLEHFLTMFGNVFQCFFTNESQNSIGLQCYIRDHCCVVMDAVAVYYSLVWKRIAIELLSTVFWIQNTGRTQGASLYVMLAVFWSSLS